MTIIQGLLVKTGDSLKDGIKFLPLVQTIRMINTYSKGVIKTQKSIFPPTSQRVCLYTKKEINKRIQDEMQRNIDYYKTKSEEEIRARIEVLDKEWDIERVLETNAASVILLGVFLSLATHQKRWVIFLGAISGFLLQHALQGWCPPLPLFRNMGIRTSTEINEEKTRLTELNKMKL